MYSSIKSSNSKTNSVCKATLHIIANQNYQSKCIDTLKQLLDKNQIIFDLILASDHKQIQSLKNKIKKSIQKHMIIIDNSGGQDFDFQDFAFAENNNIDIYTYPKRGSKKKYLHLPNAGKILSTYKALSSNRQNSNGRIRLKNVCQSPNKTVTIYTKVFVHKGKQKKSLTFQKFTQQILKLPNVKQFSIWRQIKQEKPQKRKKIFAITTLEQSQQLIKNMFDNRVSEYCDVGILGVKPNRNLFYNNVSIATQNIIEIIDFVTDRGFNLLSIKQNMIKHISAVTKKNGIYFSDNFIIDNQQLMLNQQCSNNKKYYDLTLSEIPQKKQTLYQNSKFHDSMVADQAYDQIQMMRGSITKSHQVMQHKNHVKSKWAIETSQKHLYYRTSKSDNTNQENQKQKEGIPLQSSAQNFKKDMSLDKESQISIIANKSKTSKNNQDQINIKNNSKQLINQNQILLDKKSQIVFDSSKLNRTHSQKLKSQLSQLLEDGSNFKIKQKEVNQEKQIKQKLLQKNSKKSIKNDTYLSQQKQKSKQISKASIKDHSLNNLTQQKIQNLNRKSQNILSNNNIKSNINIEYSQSKDIVINKQLEKQFQINNFSNNNSIQNIQNNQSSISKKSVTKKIVHITKKTINNNQSKKQLENSKKPLDQHSIQNKQVSDSQKEIQKSYKSINNSKQIKIDKKQDQNSIHSANSKKSYACQSQKHSQAKFSARQNDKYLPSNIIPQTSQQYYVTNRQSQGNTFFKQRQIECHGSEKQLENHKRKNSQHRNLTTLINPSSLLGSQINRQNFADLKISHLQSNSNLQKSINVSKNELTPIEDQYGLQNSMTNKDHSIIKSCADSTKSYQLTNYLDKMTTRVVKDIQANPDYFTKASSTQSSNYKKKEQNFQLLQSLDAKLKKKNSFAELCIQPEIVVIKEQQCIKNKKQIQNQLSQSLLKTNSEVNLKSKTQLKPTDKIQSQKKVVRISTVQILKKQNQLLKQEKKENKDETVKKIQSSRALSSASSMPFKIQYNFSLSRQQINNNNNDISNKNIQSFSSIKNVKNEQQKSLIQKRRINRISSSDMIVRDIKFMNSNSKNETTLNYQKQNDNLLNPIYNNSTQTNTHYSKSILNPNQNHHIINNDYKTVYISNDKLNQQSNNNNNYNNTTNTRPSRVISINNMNLDNYVKTVDQKGRTIYKSRSSYSLNLGNTQVTNNYYQNYKNAQGIYYRQN